MPPLQIILSLVGIVVVIIACYYTTYYIGAKASGQGRKKPKNKNISLIDRFSVSKDKSFCLVEIAGKVYVVGVTNQSMTLLDTLEAEVFAEAETERRDARPWHVTGGRFVSRLTKRFAAFLAHKMGRELEFSEAAGGATFADSLKHAREKDISAQPATSQAGRTDNTNDTKDQI